jgi:undecaprenyl-diphosphatase
LRAAFLLTHLSFIVKLTGSNSVFFHRMKRVINRAEAITLIVGLIIVLAIWGFVALADEVLEGDTHAFDHWVMRVLRDHSIPPQPIGPKWLVTGALSLTALGSVAVLAIVITVVVGYLWLQRKRRAMWTVLAATIGGQLLSSALKYFIGRPRPDSNLHLAEVYTASFPSGHSMLSAVVYLTLGALLASIEPSWRVRIYLIATAIMLTFIVGVSRVYIGVHYATDVLAGWSMGLAWALACWLAVHMMHRRFDAERVSSA